MTWASIDKLYLAVVGCSRHSRMMQVKPPARDCFMMVLPSYPPNNIVLSYINDKVGGCKHSNPLIIVKSLFYHMCLEIMSFRDNKYKHRKTFKYLVF